MANTNRNNGEEESDDFDVNAPNPVNAHPRFMGDYPRPKSTELKIPEMSVISEITNQSTVMNHPPKPPGTALGPYFQFISTDPKRMLWIGSALICRHISLGRPQIEFIANVHINSDWEMLYDDLCSMCVYRVNISIELRSGEGDDKVIWKVDWGDHKTDGFFLIARYDQKWRGGFFSCNGFGVDVSKHIPTGLNHSNVWNHLLSVHEETPLHLLVWGGDQNYIDFIFHDIPYLREWIDMPWNEKWTCDFRDDLKEQVERYYFYVYAENWERRLEMKKALSSIPSLMMWDDHDIFDGAGTYPPLLHDSPMMMGVFSVAQKMRLLFQHHTTVDKARAHHLFGYQGYNLFARCGRSLAILAADGRSERDTKTVHHDTTWDMIFDKLDQNLEDVQHLIVVFPVPFSFIRAYLAESIFESLKNLPNKWRNLPLVKQTNSIFGLPDVYDDLLDEWTHGAHIDERNRALLRFQQLSERKRVRITFFSGDVHCCGISRFRSQASQQVLPADDARFMYQVISSAIVNLPPSKTAIRIAHLFKTHWKPVRDTEEEVIDFFERDPDNGQRLFYKKIRPNRNWCYFEQYSNELPSAVPIVSSQCFQCFPSKENRPSPTQSESRGQPVILSRPSREFLPESVQSNEKSIGTHSLRVCLWLESTLDHSRETHFTDYELIIPHLA